MTDRIHACLDGDLPPEALSPAERARLASLESQIQEVAVALRAAPVPDLTARVLQSLPAQKTAAAAAPPSPGVWERMTGWLWRPRTISFQLRPAYGVMGVAAAVLAAVVVPVQAPAPTLPAVVAASPLADAPRMFVQFRLEVPHASQVQLAGSFTEWQPSLELREVAPGVWSALVPLEPGVHDYTFVVDGQEWVVDPYAPRVEDSFGGSNSRLFLPTPIGSV